MSRKHFESCVDAASRQDKLDSWGYAVLYAAGRIRELERLAEALAEEVEDMEYELRERQD